MKLIEILVNKFEILEGLTHYRKIQITEFDPEESNPKQNNCTEKKKSLSATSLICHSLCLSDLKQKI